MPDPSLNMALRNVGSLNTGLRSVMTLGLELKHVAYSETDSSIAFGFDDVAVSGFTLSVVPSASILAFGFDSVSVTGFDLSIDAGSDAIALGFESVDVTGFNLSINEGEQIALGFEDVSVAGFDLSITLNATAVAFGFDEVAVTGFALGIEEGSAIPTTLKDNLVGAFEFEDNYNELHAGYTITPINSPPFQDSINGRGIIMRTTTGSREIRVDATDSLDWRPLLGDFTISCFARLQLVDESIATHQIYQHKGSAAETAGIKLSYRRDTERFQLEYANGIERITLVTDVYEKTTFDDDFVHILAQMDKDGHMSVEVNGVDVGDFNNTSDISGMSADSINPTQTVVIGRGDIGLDNFFAWTRLLTTDEKTALRTLNLGYSDLP